MKSVTKCFIVLALSCISTVTWAAGGDAKGDKAAPKKPDASNPFLADFKTIERLEKQIEDEGNKKAFGGAEGEKAKKDKIEKINKQIAAIKEKIANRTDKEIKAIEDEQSRLQTQLDNLLEKEGTEAEQKKLQAKIDDLAKKVDTWNGYSSPNGPPPAGPTNLEKAQMEKKEKEKADADAAAKKGAKAVKK